jgi:hypothetical protein
VKNPLGHRGGNAHAVMRTTKQFRHGDPLSGV